VIPEIRLSATPLAEAVETLNRLSGADIKVDLPALQGAGIDPAMPVDMRLRNATLDQALTALLGYASGGNTTTLVYTLHGGGIVVTTDNALAPYTYAAVYDVRDIRPVRTSSGIPRIPCSRARRWTTRSPASSRSWWRPMYGTRPGATAGAFPPCRGDCLW